MCVNESKSSFVLRPANTLTPADSFELVTILEQKLIEFSYLTIN